MSPEGTAWPPKEWDVVESETKGLVMTEREELAAIIDDRWHGYGYHPQGAADAIIAAGYSKHSEDLAKYKRGAKALGEIIEKQCRDVLDVTGLHHLINEDGDGHWDVVWMRLFEMRDELADLKESTIARERQRGDSWRDRAQEMDSQAQTLEVELRAATERAESAEAAVERVRYLLEATDPNRYALLSMEGLRLGIRSALEEGEPVGYSKPRTITTATELEALRRFTVIRSAEGVVYEKQTMWHEAGSRDLVYWPAIALPVVVLQEGWGEE